MRNPSAAGLLPRDEKWPPSSIRYRPDEDVGRSRCLLLFHFLRLGVVFAELAAERLIHQRVDGLSDADDAPVRTMPYP